jgi:hypothetical protein
MDSESKEGYMNLKIRSSLSLSLGKKEKGKEIVHI